MKELGRIRFGLGNGNFSDEYIIYKTLKPKNNESLHDAINRYIEKGWFVKVENTDFASESSKELFCKVIMCNFHNQKKYGFNDTFCLACGERWIPYITTPFDAKIAVKRARKPKRNRHLV